MKQAITMFLWLMLAIVSSAQEVTLFDSDGEARAYIDANNNEMPIYLWSGEPVAYLKSSKKSGYCIYGFNGKHLGWFEDGLVIDHDGYVCGFVKGAINKYARYEPYKGYKQLLPYKSYAEYEPYKPYKTSFFSSTPLTLFLRQGR
jgi:hypothetical protein